MARKPRCRQWTESACLHLIDRGHNRETLFADDEDRRAFLELVRRYRDRFGFRVYHYWLTTNHFHLLVHRDHPRAVSPLMAGLLRSYVHHWHRRYGFVGHLFQGRFKSPAIQIDTYLLSCGRYIERNPLEAALVAQPWDWPWSSCRVYVLGQEDALVTPDPCYLELSRDPARRQQLWREFLLGDDPKEEVVRREDWAIGDAAFRRRAVQERGRPTGRGPGRPLQEACPSDGMARILT